MGYNIPSIVYTYYILDEVIAMYTVNKKEFPALVSWKLLLLIG